MTLFRGPRHFAVLAVAALGVAACGPADGPGAGTTPAASSSAASPVAPAPTPTRTPHGQLPDLRKLDQGDATAVSRAAVIVMWTVDAAVDRGQRDAYLRAGPLLDPQYAATISNGPVGELPAAWREHRVYARVRVVQRKPEGDVPPDTPTTARRLWAVTVTPTGRDGWKATSVHASVFVTLTRPSTSAPWRVSAVGSS